MRKKDKRLMLEIMDQLPIKFIHLPPDVKPYWMSDEKWVEVFGTQPPKRRSKDETV